jgi:hypothetical protein
LVLVLGFSLSLVLAVAKGQTPKAKDPRPKTKDLPLISPGPVFR